VKQMGEHSAGNSARCDVARTGTWLDRNTLIEFGTPHQLIYAAIATATHRIPPALAAAAFVELVRHELH
jgi:hypothetical protein